MTTSALGSVLGSEFDDFLFAPIGEDKNEVPLSVLSVLARLGIDPWQEAAELALLPRDTATQRLTLSIAALPDARAARLEHGTIAARLIGLLPHQARSSVQSRVTAPDANELTQFRAGMCMFAVFTAIMLAAQWFVASHEPPAKIDSAQAPLSSTVVPQTPPSIPGQ
jgi:hypothetical protein